MQGHHYQRLDKFGGSAITTATEFAQVMSLIGYNQSSLVVISALADTTRRLDSLLTLAISGGDFSEPLQSLADDYHVLALGLLEPNNTFQPLFESDLADLYRLLASVSQMGQYDRRLSDKILAMGEYWACQLTVSYLGPQAYLIDAAQTLIVSENTRPPISIDWQRSRGCLERYLKQIGMQVTNCATPGRIGVITGFVAADQQGQLVTLGWESSDLSASAFARLFDVDQLFLWSDVDGLYDADPAYVPDARVIPALSYSEAATLAHAGVKVLHPQALAPMQDLGRPIHIKSIVDPDAAGTTIASSSASTPAGVCGLAVLTEVSVLRVIGAQASALVWHGLNRDDDIDAALCMIIQSSLDKDIFYILPTQELDKLLSRLEGRQDQGLAWVVEEDCSVLAIVGDRMKGQPGIAATACQCLAHAGISLKAIGQGSSEHHLGMVIEHRSLVKAMRVIHAGFGLSKQRIHLALIGPGNVGQAFLSQLFDHPLVDERMDIRITAICRSKKMVIDDDGFSECRQIEVAMAEQPQATDFFVLAQHLYHHNHCHTVIIDCSGSEQVVDAYSMLMHAGCHIVTPNKLAMAGDWQRRQSMLALAKRARVRFHYETNVCAGLPIITTLNDLLKSGDHIRTITGVFSGTLGYLCDRLQAGEIFSEVVKQAHQSGLTEPDPRDDLLGQDVARKCVCLARELGVDLNLSDVALTPLVPKAWSEVSLEEFWQSLPSQDQHYQSLVADCQIRGHRLVYLGQLSASGVQVSLTTVDQHSPFFALSGTDNMVVFHTRRYHHHPLVVRGPGAGAEVTAAGVYADLIRLIASLEGVQHAHR